MLNKKSVLLLCIISLVVFVSINSLILGYTQKIEQESKTIYLIKLHNIL